VVGQKRGGKGEEEWIIGGGVYERRESSANGKSSVRQVQVHRKDESKRRAKNVTSSRSIYAPAAPSHPVDVPVRRELCA
jgi:hypothetical protein